MLDTYRLEALLLVAVIPIAAFALLAGGVAWARDAISRAPVVGWIGMLLALAAIGNLVVPRRFGEVVNRPVLAAFVGDGHAERAGMMGIALVLLVVVATAIAVRAGEVRR